MFLDLLNYEGPVLKLSKKGKNEFVIMDQWNTELKVVTSEEVFDFLDGRFSVTDSKGKVWNFPEGHESAKQKLRTVFNYVKE